jgi:uncharacterized protein YfbU (UPF0304 family)
MNAVIVSTADFPLNDFPMLDKYNMMKGVWVSADQQLMKTKCNLQGSSDDECSHWHR